MITAADGKAELQMAVDLLTTNETHFFREPKHFDFLRNVMIYFDQDTKRQVVSRRLSLLRPGGYFLVGHSETLNGINDDVRLVQPAVYRKL